MITTGPTGNVIRGDVLDVNPRALEKRLQDYDSHLYLKWNPRKRYGWGMWEVRRRPEKKSAVFGAHFEGNTIVEVKAVENDLINHILDVPYLNYQVLSRIRAMDTWGNKRWVSDLEYEERKHKEQLDAKLRAERAYNLRQEKSAIRDLREAILSGTNLAELARYWGSKSS